MTSSQYHTRVLVSGIIYLTTRHGLHTLLANAFIAWDKGGLGQAYRRMICPAFEYDKSTNTVECQVVLGGGGGSYK